MREGRAAFDVADRVDPRDVGLELRIHLDEARIVGLDACGAEVEAVGIRNAAESKEQMASRDILRSLTSPEYHTHARSDLFETRHLRGVKNIGSVFVEDFLAAVRKVRKMESRF